MVNLNCTNCKVRSDLTKSLDQQEFESLAGNCVTVPFKKGELIFKEKTIASNVVYLKTGIVKTHAKGPYKDRIYRIIKAPSFLGIPTTLGDRINNYSATALLDSTACFFEAERFKELIRQNGRFAYSIIENLCQNELLDFSKFTNQSQKQIPGILAETLLYFADHIFENDRFEVPLTRHELGELIGTSRENISRVLNDFKQAKIINVTLKKIEILQKKSLLKISKIG